MTPHAEYPVSREGVRAYAAAVGEQSALHHDPEHARAEGYPDVVAPPMFAAVYAAPAVFALVASERLDAEGQLLHGAQDLIWGTPVCAGDEIRTTAELVEVLDEPFKQFRIRSESHNQREEHVATGLWTLIVPQARGDRRA